MAGWVFKFNVSITCSVYVIYYVVYSGFDLRSHRDRPRIVPAGLQSRYGYGGYDTYYDDDEY
ncbi:hypothetical protein CSHOW_1062 [Campylobacter showae]|nr:hypothetical protein CSHOW_1062 [Campylobacter showae]